MKRIKLVSTFGTLFLVSAITLFIGCPQANQNRDENKPDATNADLKGTWELCRRSTGASLDLFLYFDGERMYNAIKKDGQFTALTKGTPFLQYKNGTLIYNAAEYLGKKNGENIDLYLKTNGRLASVASYNLKKATADFEAIKNASGNEVPEEETNEEIVITEELQGVWEFVSAMNEQAVTNLFLYFDGKKIYGAVKMNEQFIAVPQDTPFLQYENGKLMYHAATETIEYIGKKNGDNIDLYAKVNEQEVPVVVAILKPSTVAPEKIKNVTKEESPLEGEEPPNGPFVNMEELKGVWEFFTAINQQSLNLFLYFDGEKIYSAMKSGENLMFVPSGALILQYEDGKITYGTLELVGKRNGQNIDLYPKVNGQIAPVVSHILKPSTVDAEKIKNLGTESGQSGNEGQTNGEPLAAEELKGVWEFFIAQTQQSTNLFLYFDGTKMYCAVKAGENFIAAAAGSYILQYQDGKITYGTLEFVGKKNEKDIDLYPKLNGQIAPVASHTLKPSTVEPEKIKNANNAGNQSGGEPIATEELKGVWEYFIAQTQQSTNLFLYFDGSKMFAAVKVGEQFIKVPEGTPFLQYENGKLIYSTATGTIEYIGKKNGENIDLYAKVNQQETSVVAATLKPSSVEPEKIKNAPNNLTGNPPSGPFVTAAELQGVWEFVPAINPQTGASIFLYFDGTKMFAAVKVGEQFIKVPEGTPFLQYEDGKLIYPTATGTIEYIGKKNGENIDLYAKVNQQVTPGVAATLKSSNVDPEKIKNAS